MFSSILAGSLHQAHINPSTMHPEAFQASKAFIEWLDTISTTSNNVSDDNDQN